MRTRVKSNEFSSVTVAPFQENWVGHGTSTIPAGSTVITVNDQESMTDDISKGRRFKEVTHLKSRLTRSTVSDGTITSGTEVFIDQGVNCFWHAWGLGGIDFISHGNIPVRFDRSKESLIRGAFDAFYNTNEVDNLLNVVESPELVSSTTSLVSKISSLPKVAREFLRRSPTGHWGLNTAKTPRLLLSQAKKAGGFISGGYLYWSFGIAPIISDMKKIGKNLRKYRKDLAAASKRAGTEITVHRQDSGSFEPFGSLGKDYPHGYSSSPNSEKSWNATILSQSTPKRIVSIRGFRDHKYLSESFQKLDFLVSRFLGVGPASFVWERIPFSFVFDWFVDLSDVLNRLDNALTGSRKTITDASLSVKWGCLCPVFKVQYRANLTDSRDGQQIALVDLGYYNRQNISTDLSVGINDRFGKKQASILAALIGQKVANLKLKR